MKTTLNFHIRRLGPVAGIAVLAFAAQAQVLDEMDLHPLDRTVLLSGVARTKGKPTEKPDEEKGGGQITATLVVTSLAAPFLPPGYSRRSGLGASHAFTLADRKIPFVVMVSFTGARRDGQGTQNVTYDVRILRPDGTVLTERANLKAAPLPIEAVGLTLAEKDPPGVYTVEATVKDNLTNTEVPLKQRFLVNE